MLRYLPKRLRTLAFIALSLMTRATTLGVRCALFDGDGRIFLVRHTYVKGWHMPGGGVERGQTMLDAVRNEVAEEAGLDLKQTPTLFANYRNTRHSRFDHVALYIARDIVPGQLPEPNMEIAESGWFALDNLPVDTTDPTRASLREIETGAPPREIW